MLWSLFLCDASWFWIDCALFLLVWVGYVILVCLFRIGGWWVCCGCVPVLRICGLRCAGLSSLFCLTCVVLGLVDWIFGLLVALVVGLPLLICVTVVGGLTLVVLELAYWLPLMVFGLDIVCLWLD